MFGKFFPSRKMLYRALLRFFLLLAVLAAAAYAQAKPEGPVTLAELRLILSRAEKSPELIAPTNRELVAAVEERGVDFVLTPEEEWALQLREASDELIEALRSAVDPVEREYRLKVNRQQSLYLAFAQNFSSNDLTAKSTALNAGREFVTQYADDPNVAQIVTFMRRQMPFLERSVQALERQQEAMERERVRAMYRESMRDDARDNSRRNRQNAPTQNNTNTPAGNAAPAPPPNQQQQNQKPN